MEALEASSGRLSEDDAVLLPELSTDGLPVSHVSEICVLKTE
jgi:hypothetical protein